MKVRVKYYGVMRKYGNDECLNFPLSSYTCRLAEVLVEMAKTKGKHFWEMIYDSEGQFSPYMSLIVNNRVVTNDQEYVPEGSIIKIVPYIAGG